jgi:2-hydroxychromene-2-carboxylate isomerase
VLALAETEGTALAYQAATDEARRLGIFGSPSFVVDELFWGDDRLETRLPGVNTGVLARTP